jgi:hypothetical protein
MQTDGRFVVNQIRLEQEINRHRPSRHHHPSPRRLPKYLHHRRPFFHLSASVDKSNVKYV